MRKIDVLAVLVAGLAASLHPNPSEADVIAENEGLYKKETWNIQKYYDDLDDPSDAPGIITKGTDPAEPSGPASDFKTPPGALGLEYDDEESK